MKGKLCTGLKRLTLLTLTLCLLLPAGSARAEKALATGYVSSTTLNMRPDPSTHQAIVATLSRGDVVNVYEICGVWLRVDVPSLNKSGYVSGKYITLHATTGFYGLGITTVTVHVRTSNTAESESKAVVSGNTGLTLLKMEGNGWWKVKTQGDGVEGYIAKKLVKVICKAAKGASGDSGSSAATISGEGVNLRKGPSTENKSLGMLKKGTAVTVLSTSGSWCKVKVNSSGKTGYVYKTFVKQSVAKATATPKASSGSSSSAKGVPGYINASDVNLRTSGTTNSKSLGRLKKNTVLEVLSTKGDWCQVRVTETKKTGYVAKRYVSLSSSAATPTPTPAATPTPAPTPTATQKPA